MLKPLNEVVLNKPLVSQQTLIDHRLSEDQIKKLESFLAPLGYAFDKYTSYAITDKGGENKPANYALIPNQYFVYANQMYDLSTELYKYFDLYEKLKPFCSQLLGNAEHIADTINASPEMSEYFESKADVELFAKFLDKDDASSRLNSKRLINDQGTARGSRDCFGSVILKEINLPDVSSSIFGRLVYDLCANKTVFDEIRHAYLSSSSQTDSDSPNIITSSTTIKEFVRSVVAYLFEHDLEDNLFLELTETTNRNNDAILSLNLGNTSISGLFRVSDIELSDDELTTSNTPRYFFEPFKKGGKFLYLTNQWADTREGARSGRDVMLFADAINEMYESHQVVKEQNEYRLIETIPRSNFDHRLYKPFILLAGISGTGKTRFVRSQAKATGSLGENYCLTAVRPDWHEPSDLLGYVSRLSQSGCPEYVSTDVLQFISRAWRGILKSGLCLESFGIISDDGYTHGVIGTIETLRSVKPYWLCLDEMNLAPVEQYFSDYLSVLETRNWDWSDGEFVYTCDSLLKPEQFEIGGENLRKQLGFHGEQYDEFWSVVEQYGLSIPFNLIVAGTVNMDETTHSFSRKVIDRALSFDFGEFFPNDYEQYFEPKHRNAALTYPIYSHISKNMLSNAFDIDGKKSIEFLHEVNSVLKRTPFELAFRALNELLIAVKTFKPRDELELEAVWDDFLMAKVLPRIEGDIDKLGIEPSLLEQLQETISKKLGNIWNVDSTSDKARPDFYRLLINNNATKTLRIGCRTKKKLVWMQSNLNKSSFTSFWP
jgi:hypothetical protein